jgi:NADH-quinone oxidoreductase subunit J
MQALFYFYAAVALVGAAGMVIARNLIRSVLSLFVSLLALGALYLLLGSQFLAAMQLFIYGGAVTVLVLFVVMLTRAAPEKPGDFSQLTRPVSLGACIVFFLVVAGVLSKAEFNVVTAVHHDTASLATILFSRYVLPFELAGLALTIALVGAIVLARDEPEDEIAAAGESATDDLVAVASAVRQEVEA